MIDIEYLRDEAVREELDALFESIEDDSNNVDLDEVALGARVDLEDNDDG